LAPPLQTDELGSQRRGHRSNRIGYIKREGKTKREVSPPFSSGQFNRGERQLTIAGLVIGDPGPLIRPPSVVVSVSRVIGSSRMFGGSWMIRAARAVIAVGELPVSQNHGAGRLQRCLPLLIPRWRKERQISKGNRKRRDSQQRQRRHRIAKSSDQPSFGLRQHSKPLKIEKL
jgi:hypothetical protein